MRTFTVSTEGENRLGLRELCQQYVDGKLVAEHFTDAQAAEPEYREIAIQSQVRLERQASISAAGSNSFGNTSGVAMANTVMQRDGQWFLDTPNSSVKCDSQSEAEALSRALGRAEHYEHEQRPLAVTESIGDLEYAVWLLKKYQFNFAARLISTALEATKQGDDLED